MSQKHFYAYGHKLLFDSSPEEGADVIRILPCDALFLDTYSHKVFFETNQGREIYLSSPHPLYENKEEWAFVVEECVTFVCNIRKKEICYKKEEHFTQKLMEYWLIHIVLPLFFTLEGRYYLFHTGSVEVDGEAVLFMGDSYAGKSTLTDFFLAQGHALLSDDKLASFFDEEQQAFRVHASHPYHRPYRAKEDLGIKAKNFEAKSLPIAKVYWLEPVEASENVSIKELKGVQKFERLRYSTEMDIDLDQKERFRYITKFANSVSMYEVKVPHDLKKLQLVYEKIKEHIQGDET